MKADSQSSSEATRLTSQTNIEENVQQPYGPRDNISNKKLAANRKNALKSTGPKTAPGRIRSSRNSLKHGLRAQTPILPGLENEKEWKRHRERIRKDLAPIGYLNELRAIRIAELLWRLGRVPRFEANVSAAAVARVEADLHENHGKPFETSKYRDKAREASSVIKTLEGLPNFSDETRLEADSALATVMALWNAVPDPQAAVEVPGIPGGEMNLRAFDQWTAGLVRRACELFAAAGRMTSEDLLFKCIRFAYEERDVAEECELRLVEKKQHWMLLVERETQNRMLPEPAVLGTVTRYETSLERSLLRELHEFQRWQEIELARSLDSGGDVDLTVAPKDSIGDC